MSVAAYLVCHHDRTLLGLGEPVGAPAGGVSAFSHHTGARSEATFARGLWKYLDDCPGDGVALHFDSDPEFEGCAGYREIGGDPEDGGLPLSDYIAGDAEEPAVYYAKLRPGHPRSNPSGIVRRRGASTPRDEAFTRNLRWETTEFLRRAAIGLDDTDFVEVPESEAVDFVLRLLAARLRPGRHQDGQRSVGDL